MNKIILPIVIIILAISSYFFMENKSANESKSITLALSSEVDSFDPAKAFSDDSLNVLSQVFEPLYQYHYLKRPFEIIPLLAEGMPSVSEDGKTITIKIKKNVSYHSHSSLANGRKVKAQDFINQIKRIAFKPLKSTGKWLFSKRLIGFDEFSKKVGNDLKKLFSNEIKGVKALDDHTLEFKLEKPDTNFKYFLAMNFVVPLPIELINYYKNKLDQVMIGTGPYKLLNWEDKDFIKLEKNKTYRKEQYPGVGDRYAHTHELLNYADKIIPFIENVEFRVVESASVRWKLFNQGKLDIIDVPKAQLMSVLGDESKLKKEGKVLKHFTSMSSRWLAFNMKDKIVGSNKNIRKAIAHAVNYEAYIEKITKNSNFRANSIYVPGVDGYDPSRNLPYSFDLQKAKEFLSKAGYPNGKGLPVITYSTRSTRDSSMEEAKFIKEQLGNIGIKVKIEKLQFKEFLKKGRSGKLQFFTDQWIYDYPDPENLVQLLLSVNHPGVNKAGYSNASIDDYYNDLLVIKDEQARVDLLHKIEDIVNRDLPWVKLTYETSYQLLSDKVYNWRKSSVMRNFIKYIDVK